MLLFFETLVRLIRNKPESSQHVSCFQIAFEAFGNVSLEVYKNELNASQMQPGKGAVVWRRHCVRVLHMILCGTRAVSSNCTMSNKISQTEYERHFLLLDEADVRSQVEILDSTFTFAIEEADDIGSCAFEDFEDIEGINLHMHRIDARNRILLAFQIQDVHMGSKSTSFPNHEVIDLYLRRYRLMGRDFLLSLLSTLSTFRKVYPQFSASKQKKKEKKLLKAGKNSRENIELFLMTLLAKELESLRILLEIDHRMLLTDTSDSFGLSSRGGTQLLFTLVSAYEASVITTMSRRTKLQEVVIEMMRQIACVYLDLRKLDAFLSAIVGYIA